MIENSASSSFLSAPLGTRRIAFQSFERFESKISIWNQLHFMDIVHLLISRIFFDQEISPFCSWNFQTKQVLIEKSFRNERLQKFKSLAWKLLITRIILAIKFIGMDRILSLTIKLWWPIKCYCFGKRTCRLTNWKHKVASEEPLSKGVLSFQGLLDQP